MPLGNSGSINHNKVALSVESIFTPQVETDMFNDPFSYEESELIAFNNAYAKRNPAPWHAAINKLKNSMSDYVPTSVGVFSNEGFHAIMRNPKARDLYMKTVANECFRGNEHMKEVFTATFKNSVRAIQHHNGFQPGDRGTEGYDATAIHSNRSNFNGCLAFTLVGYFARCKVMEIFHPVENGQYPEYDVEYYLSYARHPQTGRLLPLPKSQRNGDMLGAFDLPTICSKWSPDNPHVIDGSESGAGNDFNGKKYFIGTKGLVKFGYKGNCIMESGFSLQHDPLNDNVSITEIWYKAGYEMKSEAPDAEPDETKPIYKLKRVRMRAGNTQGEQRLRVFSGNVILEADVIETVDNKKKLVRKLFEEFITGRVNLDTGDYAISAMSNGEYNAEMYTDHRNVDYTTPETLSFAYKLDAKLLDAANLRGGLRFTRMRIHETLRTEYTCMGTIAVSPYINDEWNIGGNQQTGYVAVMTDEMSKQYAITRDLNGEKFLMEQFSCTSDMYICTQKFGSFVRYLQHDVADVGALGGGDPFELSKKALRLKITNIFSRAETHMNMPGHEDPQRAIPRNWVGIGPERVIEAFPDIQFETLDMTNSDQMQSSATQKYGFNIEGGASFRDSLNRYTRLIGCKDERWLTRDLMFFLKSTDVQFPTLLYYAFMYRIFSGIDPFYTNLPSILFYGRDNMYALTQCMVKMAILNQDENTYTKMNNQARTRRVVENWATVPHQNVGNAVLPHEDEMMKKIEQFNKLMVANSLSKDATYENPTA